MAKKSKTNKSLKKRFRLTGSGKVMRKKMANRGSSHRRNKSRQGRKDIQKRHVIDSVEEDRVKKLIK